MQSGLLRIRLVRDFGKVLQQRGNLIGLELEHRHIGMPGHNAFRKRLLQVFHRPLCGKCPERRCKRQLADIRFVDGVTTGTMLFGQRLARRGLVHFLRMHRHWE